MKSPTRHPGIGKHAKSLRVTTHHLRKVLDGVRQSPDLLARYKALVAAEQAAAEPDARHFPAGSVFRITADLATARLVAAHPESLRLRGDAIEVVREITLTLPAEPEPATP